MDKQTSLSDITSYNNYYEFGLDKSDPAAHAGKLQTRPWTVSVEGEVGKPRTFDIEELLKLAPMEERVYRLRCVEGWSMVIPWVGYSLSALLKQVEPTTNAKYVEFVTVVQRDNMPGVRAAVLDWPYVEGLRIDEAMHPLAMLVFGLYGKVLPNQNGAPLRLAVPWKYGFKSAKSLVKIRLVEKQPVSSWIKAAPQVWLLRQCEPGRAASALSQASERRIGEDGLFSRSARRCRSMAMRIRSRPFTGHGPEGQLLRRAWPGPARPLPTLPRRPKRVAMPLRPRSSGRRLRSGASSPRCFCWE